MQTLVNVAAFLVPAWLLSTSIYTRVRDLGSTERERSRALSLGRSTAQSALLKAPLRVLALAICFAVASRAAAFPILWLALAAVSFLLGTGGLVGALLQARASDPVEAPDEVALQRRIFFGRASLALQAVILMLWVGAWLTAAA
jgi:hypothetical protein